MSARTLLVTGATGGVGRELLTLARAAEWDVVGLYRADHAAAASLREAWGGAPGLRLHACDLTSPEQVEALLEALGPDFCPDALVHLASPPLQLAPLHRTGWEEFERQLDGVLKAAVLLTQPLLRRMLRRGHGRVIAALSSAAIGRPPRGFGSYATAKYALAGYMRSLAAEYAGRGISANTVSAGPMDTAMLRELPAPLREELRASIPGGEWIAPRAVAGAIWWLAADAGAELTGCNLPLSAGAAF